MIGTMVIAIRELRSFFRLPVGWVVIALFVLLMGAGFSVAIIQPGQPATLRTLFGWGWWMMLVIAPAVSMRLLSEELRAGTIEPLATAPLGDLSIVLGKYLGGVLFLVCLLVPTAAYPIALHLLSDPAPDIGPILAGYLALLLSGLVYLAFGLVGSALTSSQTLAYLGSLLAIIGIWLLSTEVADRAPEWLAPWLVRLDVGKPVAQLARGEVTTTAIAGPLLGTIWLLCLAYVCLGWRRWR
ncbi:MAG: ABC transporter permease [Planctomycetota bacterium]